QHSLELSYQLHYSFHLPATPEIYTLSLHDALPISKGISAGHGQNAYRGLVRMMPTAKNARNYTQCDSLLIGDRCGAHTFPYIESDRKSTRLNSSHVKISYAVFCLKKKKRTNERG